MLRLKRSTAIVSVSAVLLLMITANAQAAELLSNLPAGSTGPGTNLGLGQDAADRTKAVGITMSASAMTFTSLEALINNASTGAVDSVLSGGIYSSVGGNPGALLAAFTPVPILANTPTTEVSITTAASFALQANTSYWFVLDGPNTPNLLLWQSLNPNLAPTANGATFDGYRFSANGGSTWTNSTTFNGVRISAVPEPAGIALVLVAVLGLALTRRR